MHPELYSDGVGEIAVSGTIVRVDVVSLSPTERDANNNPKPVFRQRRIVSVEAVANSVEVTQDFAKPQPSNEPSNLSRTPRPGVTAQ